MTTVGVHLPLLVAVGAFALAALVLLLVIIAPWKSVRAEPGLDDDVETRLLLGEDPAEVAADVDAADSGGAVPAEVREINEGDDGFDPDATFDDLRDE